MTRRRGSGLLCGRYSWGTIDCAEHRAASRITPWSSYQLVRISLDDAAPPRWVRPLLAVLMGMLLGQLAFDGLTLLTLVGGAALLLAAVGTFARPHR